MSIHGGGTIGTLYSFAYLVTMTRIQLLYEACVKYIRQNSGHILILTGKTPQGTMTHKYQMVPLCRKSARKCLHRNHLQLHDMIPHDSYIPKGSDTKEGQISVQVSSSFLWVVLEPGILSVKEPSVSVQYNG